MSCEGCKGHDKPKELEEVTAVKHAVTIGEKYKFIWAAVVAIVLMVTVMAGCMVYATSNAQRIANEAAVEAIKSAQEEMNKALLEAMETVAEMEVVSETTTTTVTQDSGGGPGNNVYLDGDNTEYNEAPGGDE